MQSLPRSTWQMRWQGRAFAGFLAETRQPARVVELFWDPVVLSACNLPSARCEAAHALKVFDEGMLAHRFAGAPPEVVKASSLTPPT
jgi:hypothetical protein